MTDGAPVGVRPPGRSCLCIAPRVPGLREPVDQAWLLALDILVRPNRTAGNELTRAGGDGEATARLRRPVSPRWMSVAPPLFASTPGGCAGSISGPALSGCGFVHGAAGYDEVIAAEQAFRTVNGALFASQLQVELTAEPATVHEGHDGPGDPMTLAVTVVSLFHPLPVPVTCGFLTAYPLPGIRGPLEGATVSWEVPALLRQRGSLTLDGGPFLNLPGRTDRYGQSSMEFIPQEEAARGEGVLRSEVGLVIAAVDPREALLRSGAEPAFAMMIPPVRPAIEVATLEWHEAVGWMVTAEVATAQRAMTIRGEWDGRFRLVEEDSIRGDGSLKTTVTGTCIEKGESTGPLFITGHREGDVLHVRLADDLGEASEEDVQFTETLECAVRTLVELPAFFAATAELVERMRTAERGCPLEVPVSARSTEISCGGVDFTVTRLH